ncbi:Fic family protein [Lamprobacter modestohalophilus]|uniref:Fic family protein n=1 Tax=Lamprobacter modestohalophilus TaxID=1064514 RepID=UPI002ADEDF07|nr:Fic family protein [Lamprobacter modestohalophilus]MEA1053474.1 Fic family protein [Lamprobacter modestohalophilus]
MPGVAFDRRRPFNDLPPLPPAVDLETPPILKQAIAAHRVLAELKGLAKLVPNQAMLVDGLVLQEARLSSEIENVLTTNDALYRAAADDRPATDPHTKEVLRYREALWHGFRALGQRPLATNLFIEIAGIIKESDLGIRRVPGTKIANSQGEVIYTPPEGEAVIRDKLANLERYLHAQDGTDPLIKLAVLHYQFEAIHPFVDGNGRTGRILNILYLVEQGLLELPVLYLSHYIIHHKSAYYAGLRQVTEAGDWQTWVAYLLNAVETTARQTQERVLGILDLMTQAQARVSEQAPKIYSKDLIEVIFMHPYCKIRFLEEHGIAKRQTASLYLQTLESLGLLRSQRMGRELYYINDPLFRLLTA